MEGMATILKWLWRSWKNLVHSINDGVAWILMTVTYIIAIAPIATGFKIFTDDVLDRGLGDPQLKSYWKKVKREEEADNIRRVQRQY